jgi:hypothetical protein
VTSATGKQTEAPTTLSRADHEEVLRRKAKPGSPVLSVFLRTERVLEMQKPSRRSARPGSGESSGVWQHRCIFAVVNATA